MIKTVSDGRRSVWLSSSAIYDTEGVTSGYVTGKQWNNLTESESDFFISKEDYIIAHRVVACGCVPALAFFGLPANIINMVVFYRQGLKDKMNLCLFALAFIDFMYLLSLFMTSFHCIPVFLSDSLWTQILRWYITRFTVSFRNAFVYCSGILTAVIATERCICVVFPLKSATILNTKAMAWIIFGIIVVSNILCLPYYLKHVVRWVTDETGNAKPILGDTDLYVNNRLAFQIVRDGILPTISFVTFCIISFVTMVTVNKLKTAMDWRQKTSSNVIDKRQMSLVKILITVSCVYIVCTFPKLTVSVVKFLSDDFSTVGKYSNMFYVTTDASLTLLMVNSSVNVLIYYRQSSRFRKELRECFCCFKDQIENK